MTEYFTLFHVGGDTWALLHLEPRSLDGCRKAIWWQRSGLRAFNGAAEPCTYDPVRKDFVGVDTGIPRIPGREPHTEEAWAAFVHTYPLATNDSTGA